MNDAQHLTILTRITICGILSLFAACGGGSVTATSDSAAAGSSNNSGDGPTISLFGPSATEAASVELKGRTSFKLADVDCSLGAGFINYASGTQTVSVRNETNGNGGTALPRVNCTLPILANWSVAAGIIMLEMGSNTITATVSGGNSATITIVRQPDTTPPAVLSTTPADGSGGFPVSGGFVRAEFSDDIDAATINSTTFTVEDPAGSPVPGTVTYHGPSKTATFRVDAQLTYLTTYTARLSTVVTDDAGNPLAAEFSWTFGTESNPDVWPPHKIGASPAAGNTCVAQDSVVAVRLDESMAPASVSTASFVLENSAGRPVAGVVTLDDRVATFVPSAPLGPDDTFTVRLTAGMTDLAGNPLSPDSWSFTTEPAAEGTWTPIATPANIEGRAQHSAVWTGTQMIVWGGYTYSAYNFRLAQDHGRYDPVQDQWSNVSTVGAPVSRRGHTAVWTGTKMIVWGGATNSSPAAGDFATSSGGRYDPATDTWTSMSFANAPSARIGHAAIWTGAEMIVWGGRNFGSLALDTGARYDPVTDTWTPMSTINAPSGRNAPHAVFDGQRMIVWGGNESSGGVAANGAVYDPATDVWSPLPTQDAPDFSRSGLRRASVVWTGADMLVWSPAREFATDPVTDEFTPVFTSQARRYRSAANQWTPVVAACDPQSTSRATWLNGRLLSWSQDFGRGQSYLEASDTWVPITPYPGTPASSATVLVVGDSVIVWGGETGYHAYTNTGYRLSF